MVVLAALENTTTRPHSKTTIQPIVDFRDQHEEPCSSSILPAVLGSGILMAFASYIGYCIGKSDVSKPQTSEYEFKQQVIPHASTSTFIRRLAVDRCVDDATHDEDEYDLAIHVAGIFILLTAATAACAFPIFILRFPKLRIPSTWLFAIRHLGTGVLIATAFVHLLPTAFETLTEPCLPSFWTNEYPPMAGAIVMAAVLFVVCVEMVFSPASRVQRPSDTDESTSGSGVSVSIDQENTPSSPVDDSQCAKIDTSLHLTTAQHRQKALVQCGLLEASILCHSIFIGMALSVTLGNDFIIFLVAIIFHQTCEGLALGSRIAAISWSDDALQPWLMAVAYGAVVPIGQALGIATRALYSPSSTVGLLTTGIFNAISAGFLIWASLVEMLSEDFMSEQSWEALRGKNRCAAFCLVILGSFAMALIGTWA